MGSVLFPRTLVLLPQITAMFCPLPSKVIADILGPLEFQSPTVGVVIWGKKLLSSFMFKSLGGDSAMMLRPNISRVLLNNKLSPGTSYKSIAGKGTRKGVKSEISIIEYSESPLPLRTEVV